ncbi:DoxX family protein [Nonomuraea sp. NPDC004354]
MREELIVIVLIVLAASTLVFRLLGALGVSRFHTWAASAAHGMAVMLVVAASAHFVPEGVTVMPNHADMVGIVPPFVPFPSLMVYVTGVLELLGALGLVIPSTRWAAGIALALLFVLLLPANIYAAVTGIPFGGKAATPLWQRIPEQVLYITIVLRAAATAPRPQWAQRPLLRRP